MFASESMPTAPDPSPSWHGANLVCLGGTALSVNELARGGVGPGWVSLLAGGFALGLLLFVGRRVFRRPPAPTTLVEPDGTRVLRWPPWRRVTIQLIGLSVIGGATLHDAGLDLPALGNGVFIVFFMGFTFLATGERYRFSDEWIERTGGLRPKRRWEWKSIESVIEIPGGVILLDRDGRELVLFSQLFSGYPEFMAKVASRPRPHGHPGNPARA